MITNIDIDEDLVADAMKVSGARTKREVVDRALREMVARARRPRFRDFLGVGDIDPAYDPKASSPEEAGRHRVEQPRAPYQAAASRKAAPRKSARKSARKS
ncbi:MAG: type II toxin-antitoxin system VapB family antitoxin [Comamonadaceae bacterium]|nr:MAG: type II toxin-antitoxin system VapB family antitoxin [Comamonadaceae bacterium]